MEILFSQDATLNGPRFNEFKLMLKYISEVGSLIVTVWIHGVLMETPTLSPHPHIAGILMLIPLLFYFLYVSFVLFKISSANILF